MIGPQIVTNFHKLICVDMCIFVDDSTLRFSAFLHFSISTRLKIFKTILTTKYTKR